MRNSIAAVALSFVLVMDSLRQKPGAVVAIIYASRLVIFDRFRVQKLVEFVQKGEVSAVS